MCNHDDEIEACPFRKDTSNYYENFLLVIFVSERTITY